MGGPTNKKEQTTMLIYLAHPIDNHPNKLKTELDRQIEYARHLIKGTTHHLYHPGGAFVVGHDTKVDHTIEQINRQAQETAQGLMVLLPDGSKTWGVPAEIERARHLMQPVAIISDTEPTWAMPTPQTDPLVRWYRPDPGNFSAAIRFLDKHQTSADPDRSVIPWVALTEEAQKPTRAYRDDAGYDLYVSETVTAPPHRFVDVHTQVAVELPKDTWALLTGRSSTTRDRGLLVNQGIIDPGYRGELYIGVWNLTDQEVTIERGDRIGQLIVIQNRTATTNLYLTDQLTKHPRGEKGFGSSGR